MKKHIYWPQRGWTLGLTFILLMAGPFVAISAQTSKLKITATGTHSTFDQGLSKPVQFLQTLQITPEDIQKKLEPRPHIFVVGAGFVRNVGLVSFTNTVDAQSTQSSIHVEGAGSARVVRLAAFTEVPDQQSSKPGIHVVGAGSMRNMGLVAPPVQ